MKDFLFEFILFIKKYQNHPSIWHSLCHSDDFHLGSSFTGQVFFS